MDNTSMREALEAARDLLLPQCNGGTAFAKACGETVNKIMDALKDERTSDGNAAALREALEKCLHYLTGETELVEDEIIALCDVMNAALAAPPRNCDRFATVKDAAIAFARERQDAPHPCPDFTFSAWLFELAMEKEAVAKWNAFAKRVAPGETKGAEGK